MTETEKTGVAVNGEEVPQGAYMSFNTKEDYQKHIDGIIGRRLRDYRELKERLSSYESEPVPSDDDVERAKGELLRITEGHIATRRERGEEVGLTGEQLIGDRRYLALISAGCSLEEAYNAVNHESIVAAAVKKAVRDTADDVLARGLRRPHESAIESAPGAASKNIGRLSYDEIDEINKRVARGERVVL